MFEFERVMVCVCVRRKESSERKKGGLCYISRLERREGGDKPKEEEEECPHRYTDGLADEAGHRKG